MQDEAQKKLLHHYLKANLPGVLLFIILYLTDHYILATPLHFNISQAVVALLILQGFFAIGAPLGYRIWFIRQVQLEQYLQKNRFLRFEKKFISISALTIYLLIIGYLAGPSRIPLSLMVLFGIYVLYFYFPSQKRMASEKRIFRVSDQEPDKTENF
mgnify:CR=1 FL=1